MNDLMMNNISYITLHKTSPVSLSAVFHVCGILCFMLQDLQTTSLLHKMFFFSMLLGLLGKIKGQINMKSYYY